MEPAIMEIDLVIKHKAEPSRHVKNQFGICVLVYIGVRAWFREKALDFRWSQHESRPTWL